METALMRGSSLSVRCVRRYARSGRSSVRAQAQATSSNKAARDGVVERVRSKVVLASKTVGVQLMLALPALAEEAEKEPGKLFDFDLTLPIMAAQFLVLMVFLDKTWFSPVGKVLDDRDENLRNILSGVQDNSGDVQKMEDEAAKVVSDARTAAANLIASEKKAAQDAGDEKLASLKKKLDAQYEAASAALVKEEEGARKALEPEIEKLAKQIVEKVA
ncbi:subunit b' of chloroplast F-type H+-transporting ATPase [Chloropicon primus]|uniref:Subunit b' of chloroplast F-type H+-transporting ATPase n=1 Tax=Chloropicon primus TaxID=1764295 RepID=A0A5B8MF37_9CHLO|nr:subunit b' of chloroplast F-type H+-transporting ATPase [Chloropicon primus]UPQ97516.1 subunit b' of chloroplast F-type H+-transporting ATPase [Chloropicon primus]|eukprot:QDZ18305.1 subunit b' of chloroplast F-type H+-transporting ATPase [Chloropicon primus]